MNCWYLIILMFLCNCNGNSPFSGCVCNGNAPRGAGNVPRGGKNDQRNSQREHGCGCDSERTQGYGSFGYNDGMMQTRDFAGFPNNCTCGCEEKQDAGCGCENS